MAGIPGSKPGTTKASGSEHRLGGGVEIVLARHAGLRTRIDSVEVGPQVPRLCGRWSRVPRLRGRP